MVPIIKVSKISVKDIILNNVTKNEKKKTWRLPVSIIFIIFAIVFPRTVSPKLALLVDGICMILLLIATLFIVPYVVKLFIIIFERLYIYIFGNEGVLAVKNLRGNKNVINNIALLAIGMSALLMISTISNSLAIEIPKAYKQWNFDVYLRGNNLDDDFMNSIKNIKGVMDVNGVYSANQVKLANSKDFISEIDGVDKSKFTDYNVLKYLGDKETMVNELCLGRNIIVTKILRDKYDWKIGDKITLDINNAKKEYTILGFVDSQWNNGSVAFIADNYFKQDINSKNYAYLAIKTKIPKDADNVKKFIAQKYSKRGIYVATLEELTKRNVQNNAQFMVLLNGFAIMAMVIGSFGILNNYMISFMERKRSMAIFRSIGMSKIQNIKVLFIEAFTGGIIGGCTGIVSSILMISITPYLVEATSNFSMEMHYSIYAFLTAFLAATILTIIASIGPAIKSSKLNIIEAIKYE
jgi:putative ABC transport system permease protein